MAPIWLRGGFEKRSSVRLRPRRRRRARHPRKSPPRRSPPSSRGERRRRANRGRTHKAALLRPNNTGADATKGANKRLRLHPHVWSSSPILRAIIFRPRHPAKSGAHPKKGRLPRAALHVRSFDRYGRVRPLCGAGERRSPVRRDRHRVIRAWPARGREREYSCPC